MRVETGDGWTMILGRWQDSAPESVDVVVSDPPFDNRTSKGARSSLYSSPEAKRTAGSREISRPVVTSFGGINPSDVGPPLLEIARRWVVLFCAVEQLGLYQTAVNGSWVRAGAWVKTNPTPQFTGDRPATWGEGIAIMHRPGRKRWNRGGHAAIWTHTSQHAAERHREHETQKPVALMLDLVSAFSDPGELVWDPYAGSATTGVACLRLGRRFLGHEMQEHYFEIACERLRAEKRGLTLQDAKRGQTSILDAIGEDS